MKKTTRQQLQSEMDREPISIRQKYKGSEKLSGKVALITGGDSGIGRSIALHYAREGADVAILYLNEDKDAIETARLIEAEGRQCLRIRGDAKSLSRCRSARP